MEKITKTKLTEYRQRLFAVVLGSAVLGVGLSFAAAAPLFDPSDPENVGYIAPLTLSDTRLAPHGATAYQPWFDNVSWAGDLVEHTVSASGQISTSVDLTWLPPTTVAGVNWSARLQLETQHWDSGRKIITFEGGSQIPFRWSSLSDAARHSLDLLSAAGSATSSPVLDHLRGDRSLEGGLLRQRSSVLGDIVHSNPVYVPDTAGDRVYVGANDGMLHAFDAATGAEVYAYIPGLLLPELAALTENPYQHRYYVDGELGVGEVPLGGGQRTVLAGGLGAGGRGLFALDVTSPALSGEASNTGDDRKVLWELGPAADPDLGFIYHRPLLLALADGKGYVVSGNGYGAASGAALVYLVEVASGAVIKLATDATAAVAGLSGAAAVDDNGDGAADAVYAGDSAGRLWKFDLSSSNPGDWQRAAQRTLLIDLGTSRPIAVTPEITAHPYGGYIIYVATAGQGGGQTVNAVWDRPGAPFNTSNLLTQTLSEAAHAGGETVRLVSDLAVDWASHSGWQVTLPGVERVLSGVALRGERLQLVASDTNVAGGPTNWLLELNYLDGGPPAAPIFDLDGDAGLGTGDNLDGNGDGDSLDPADIAVGRRTQDGHVSRPTLAWVGNGVDTLFMNHLDLGEYNQTCTSNCEPGFQGGHMDVDTDSAALSGYGGSTDGHKHEYDDAFDVTYVDYFNLLDNGLDKVTAVGIDPDARFVVLLANADLSPGGVLTLNTRQWNVVEYQKMIQQKLAGWSGATPLLADDGTRLDLTLNEITAAGGTLRIEFSDMAIVEGGLHPTNTGCVKSDPNITNGRWRNGALTMHLTTVGDVANIVHQRPGDLLTRIPVDGGYVTLREDSDGDGVVDTGYGGLLAGAAGFLYESTLFWHYPPGECYGDPGYRDAVLNEFVDMNGGITQALFERLYGAELEAYQLAYNALQVLLATNAPQADIDAQLQLVNLAQQALAAGQQYLLPHPGGGGGTPTASATAASVETVIQAGPSFNPGRKAWTEVIPH